MNTNKKEHFDNSNSDEVIVTFYAFDYCGYCKKFMPTWERAKEQHYPHKVNFRYFEANKLTAEEKQNIPHYVEATYAPMVVMTVNGENIEFQRQQGIPMDGLADFITSKGN